MMVVVMGRRRMMMMMMMMMTMTMTIMMMIPRPGRDDSQGESKTDQLSVYFNLVNQLCSKAFSLIRQVGPLAAIDEELLYAAPRCLWGIISGYRQYDLPSTSGSSLGDILSAFLLYPPSSRASE
jgi:hypothetical protein